MVDVSASVAVMSRAGALLVIVAVVLVELVAIVAVEAEGMAEGAALTGIAADTSVFGDVAVALVWFKLDGGGIGSST